MNTKMNIKMNTNMNNMNNMNTNLENIDFPSLSQASKVSPVQTNNNTMNYSKILQSTPKTASAQIQQQPKKRDNR